MNARPIVTRAGRRGATLLLCLAVVADAGCRGAPPAAEARAAVPDGEVRIAADSPKRSSLVVDTVRAVTERVIATLPAQVVPDEGHTVRVASPVVGRIVRLDAQPGDRVHAGQALAEIRSGDAAQATSDAAKAQAAWSTARTSLARASDLYEHKIIAGRELEQARNDEAQAHAELARARARAAQLGVGGAGVSDLYVLRAPMGGVVIDRAANPGAEVRPDAAQSLFTISSLEQVWLAVSVPQRDLAQVHRGAKLRFRTEAVPDRVFDARVSFVSDALDPVSRTATARAVLPNPGGLLHVQTTGEAQLLVAESTATAALPTRALVTHGSDTVVFVEVAPGRFVRRVVTVRDDDGITATIAAGLAPGERVVTTGSLLLAAEADRAR
jgi:cobalt-zinc-cadmium efflux system membrane fusion protein